MRHFTFAVAGGLVLLSTHAIAAPFSDQTSSGISGQERSTKSVRDGSIFEATLNMIGFSKASKPADQEFVMSYRDSGDQCPDKHADEDDEAVTPAPEETRSGPEPIYFGF